MADPSSLRTRRSRAHRAGDHSLCRPERCPDAPAPTGAEETAGGEIEAALDAYLAGLDVGRDDPRGLIAALAGQLAKALDRQTTASLARELRSCLTQLIELAPNDEGRVAARRMLADLKELMTK